MAGGGRLPLLIAESAAKADTEIIGTGFPSDTDPALEKKCSVFKWLKLGQLSKLINFFHKHGAEKIIFAGTINKPRALDLRPDVRAAKLIFSLGRRGDDALLRAVGGELEEEGFLVDSCLNLLPGLKAPQGTLTSRSPNKLEKKDMDYGRDILRSTGKLDIGQCVAVHEQMTVAVEAMEGTNSTIARAGELTRGRGGTIIKGAKPGQDLRFDQPALGEETIRTMARAKATCLAFCSKTCIFFELEKSISFAEDHGICLVGLPGL